MFYLRYIEIFIYLYVYLILGKGVTGDESAKGFKI